MEEVLNILYDFLFTTPEGVTTAFGPLLVGGLLSVAGGLFKSGAARRAARRAREQKNILMGQLKSLENGRQPLINPYSNTKDLSSLATDLSGGLSNPYGNLSVATGASKMQAEEADLSLANTLDTLRATGGSAGGATALAQAALASKKGVAANIEQQEAANEKMRAQGEQYLEQARFSEGQRLQGIAISEGKRTQAAESAGRAFKFSAQEKRKDAQLAFTRQQITGEASREFSANQAAANAIGDTIGSLGSSLISKGTYTDSSGVMQLTKFK